MHSSVINYLCERLIEYCNYSKHKKQFIVGICMVNINKIIINHSYCSLYQINNINSLSLAMLVVWPMSGVYIKAYCHNYIKLQIRGGELSIYWTWKGHKFYPSWEMRHMYILQIHVHEIMYIQMNFRKQLNKTQYSFSQYKQLLYLRIFIHLFVNTLGKIAFTIS